LDTNLPNVASVSVPRVSTGKTETQLDSCARNPRGERATGVTRECRQVQLSGEFGSTRTAERSLPRHSTVAKESEGAPSLRCDVL